MGRRASTRPWPVEGQQAEPLAPGGLQEEQPDPLPPPIAGAGHQRLGTDPELAGCLARLHQLDRAAEIGPVADQQRAARLGAEAAEVTAARKDLAPRTAGGRSTRPVPPAGAPPPHPPPATDARHRSRQIEQAGATLGGPETQQGFPGQAGAGLEQQIAAWVAAEGCEQQGLRQQGLQAPRLHRPTPGPGEPGWRCRSGKRQTRCSPSGERLTSATERPTSVGCTCRIRCHTGERGCQRPSCSRSWSCSPRPPAPPPATRGAIPPPGGAPQGQAPPVPALQGERQGPRQLLAGVELSSRPSPSPSQRCGRGGRSPRWRRRRWPPASAG